MSHSNIKSHSDSHSNLKEESPSHSLSHPPKETHTFRHMADKLFGHSHPHKDTHDVNAHGTHTHEPVHAEKVHIRELAEPVQLHKEFSNVTLDSTVIEGAPIVHRHVSPPILETHVRPTLMEQTVREEKVLEVQPIIHRVVTEPEVHIIERHIYETVPVVGPHTITKQAIVEEVVKPRILEEIQPVVHRDVPAPFIEHIDKHINEKISLPATHSKEVLTERREINADEAIRGGLVAAVVPAPVLPPVVHSHREAAVIETRVGSTVVEETTRPEIITEIQPIIHREIDAPEVHIIEKHTAEHVPMVGPHHITKQAIIEEEVHPRIIEEIQPVVHREVPVAVVEHVEQHTTEEVVAPVINSREVRTEKHVAAPVALLSERDIVVPSVPIVHSHKDAPALSVHTRSTIVEETARPEKIVEVQPIIHREVDAPEIHVVEKHLYEKVANVAPTLITKQAIVEEVVVPKVVEEILPVLHREVPVAVVEHVEAHTNERMVLPTITTTESHMEGVTPVHAHMAPKKAGIVEEAKMEAGKVAREVKFEAQKLKEEAKEKMAEKKMEREERKMEREAL